MSDSLTHFDDSGAARMVSIATKPETPRTAVAQATVRMHQATFDRIHAGGIEKGDVLGVARLAGIGAAKQTASLVPLCHPVRLVAVDVSFEPQPDLPGFAVQAEVAAIDRTGPEMEAMTAASVAALTIYDMCKAVDRGMEIERVWLVRKSGGKSGTWVRPAPNSADPA
ncbi:MAG: cyclic pyranopterin monophosphate synthase MoaC [Myxococcales bacterium FL481]|nr:MAG: cyclic pyranopterin monophosphate synthase MoaC [Myxococcales bacterium FL481]